MTETPEQIAARYGAVCRPGLRVTVCPPATFSEREPYRCQRAVAASIKGNEFNRRASLDLFDRIKGRVAAMHATGATHAEMAQAVGVATITIRKTLTRLGLRLSHGAHDT